MRTSAFVERRKSSTIRFTLNSSDLTMSRNWLYSSFFSSSGTNSLLSLWMEMPMALRGFLISWAMPEASLPSDTSLSFIAMSFSIAESLCAFFCSSRKMM